MTILATTRDPQTARAVSLYYQSADDSTSPQTPSSLATHFVGDDHKIRVLEQPDFSADPNNQPYSLVGETRQRVALGIETAESVDLLVPTAVPEVDDQGLAVARLAEGTEIFLLQYANLGTSAAKSEIMTHVAATIGSVQLVYASVDGGLPNHLRVAINLTKVTEYF